MKIAIAAASTLVAFFGAMDAGAFCIYNDTNTTALSESIDYAKNGKFAAIIDPGKNSCCNYKEKSCNPTGKQDALLDHQLRIAHPGSGKGYVAAPTTNLSAGAWIDCAPPRERSGLTDRTNFFTAKIQAGGYVKFFNNPAFKKNEYISPDNPPYTANVFATDHKPLATYTCPNKDNWTDKTRGPHGRKAQ